MTDSGSARPTTTPSIQAIRIFLSSPGDVTDERNLARVLIKDQLPYIPAFRSRLAFEVIAWDDPAARVPMLANETPQESVNQSRPRPATCDVTIVILWSRLGTPLPETIKKPNGESYGSGTEWEYLDAATSPFKPKVLIYRRTEEPKIGLKDPKKKEKEEQFDKVEAFFKQFRNEDGSLLGGINEYDTPTGFKDLLRQHLEEIAWQRLQSLDAQTPESVSPSVVSRWTGSPYPGLRPFRSTEAAIFFGRARETDALIALLRDAVPRFTAVVGDSGTGKSSLVYAGLLPRLRAGGIEGSANWSIVDCKPAYLGDDPFLSLADSLIRQLPDLQEQRAADVAQKLRTKGGSISEITAIGANHTDSRVLMLFIDQLEELFTQCADAHCQRFTEVLAEFAANARCRVIATLRADFLAAAAKMAPLEPLLQGGTFPLGPPGRAAIVDMIREPATVAGVGLDDDFVDALLEDAGDARGALPVVAFCLRQLYASNTKWRIALNDYVQIGRLRGSLAQHADAVIKDVEQRYGPSATNDLSSMFRALITVDTLGIPTRQRVSRATLATNSTTEALLDAFIAARLLVVSESSATVEVAHEALFECWPALATWIEGNRVDLLALAELTTDAERWDRSGKRQDDSYLLRGGRLQLATQLRDQRSEQFSETVKAFIEESLRRANSEAEADRKLSLYEQVRGETLKKYVRPFLERRRDELAKMISQQREGFIRYTETQAASAQEISEIGNLLDPSGKWHPAAAQHFRDLGADMDYTTVWEFPCCGIKVLGLDEPSQFRADGCEVSPMAPK